MPFLVTGFSVLSVCLLHSIGFAKTLFTRFIGCNGLKELLARGLDVGGEA